MYGIIFGLTLVLVVALAFVVVYAVATIAARLLLALVPYALRPLFAGLLALGSLLAATQIIEPITEDTLFKQPIAYVLSAMWLVVLFTLLAGCMKTLSRLDADR